jgi:hypothetical protein
MGLREDNERAARVPKGKWADYLAGEYTPPPAPYPSDPSAKPITGNYEWIKVRGD